MIPSLRLFFLICMLFLTAGSSYAQNTRLTFRPVRAVWSPALQRIVMVSTAPNELHLFDPVARAVQTLALTAAPVSLSISPNGLFAAVGHVGSASYVDLTTRSIVRMYEYPGVTQGIQSSTEVVLANEWLYVLPIDTSTPFSIRLSTGTVTSGFYGSGNGGKLHPEGRAIYATPRYGSSYLNRIPITETGVLGGWAQSSNLSDSHCGEVWFSPDGSRIYDSCGAGVRYNADPLQDMRSFGRFFSAEVRAFSESSNGRIAVIPSQSSVSSSPGVYSNNKVILLAASGFEEVGQFSIPEFVSNGRSFVGQGRWVFFNNSGSALHVVYQSDISSGLLNDFAIQTYDLAALSSCAATFPTPTLTVGNEGGIRVVEVESAPECVYNAASALDWVQILTGGFGTGRGRITLHIRSNPGAAARTGSITAGLQSLQITQAGAPLAAPPQQIFSYKIREAEYSKPLDRIVLVTDTLKELHLYDPLTRADQVVALAHSPLSLSVSPDGLKAAVGHRAFVSIVNLQTRTVEKVIPTPGDATKVLLTGDTWVYSSGGVTEIATGAFRPISGWSSEPLRLHASRNWAYLVSSYSGFPRLDVRNGGTAVSGPPGGAAHCGNVWVSEDGRRLYTACGTVHRSSDSPEDGVPNGSFAGVSQPYALPGWIAHSSARQQIALLTTGSNSSSQYPAEVQLYGDDGLPLLGRVRLAQRISGVSTLPVRGRWLFWNQAVSRLYAISQIDSSQVPSQTTAPLSDFSLEVVTADSLAACSVSVTPQSLTIPGAGGTAEVMVQTGPSCVWSATSDNSSFWIRLNPYSGQPSTGIGPGPLSLTIDRNSGSTARTGTLIIGGAVVTVFQALPKPLSVSPLQISLGAEGTNYSTVYVTAIETNLPWSAVSNSSWIQVQAGANSVGSGYVQYRVTANTGPARSGTMIIAGETVRIDQAAAPLAGNMRFVPVAPCRVVDTRSLAGEAGAFGLPVMEQGTQRDFPIPQGRCNIPANATAYSLNATVVPRGVLSYLTLWPAGSPRPLASTLNSFDGRVKANAAIVPAGIGGAISAFVTDRTDVILDINGYFVPATSAGGFPFYSLTPCRVVDTRGPAGAVGGPSLSAGQTRNFSISGACTGTTPINAAAYSLNVTVIPRSASLGYLTIWPAGLPQPVASTLNAPTGTVVANAAIVPGGVGGFISVYATDAVDVVIDINGYFGSGSGAALSFYPVRPCRLSDTRTAGGVFGGPLIVAAAARTYPVPTGTCGVSSNARAYSLNATVVPTGSLSYLTIWPTGQTQPGVSTLNSFDGSVVANAVLVPAGTSGSINAFVTDQTHLILDINGYFAP